MKRDEEGLVKLWRRSGGSVKEVVLVLMRSVGLLEVVVEVE